jgi:uncharacterized protein involved in exopolysaccharide biosynthesis
MADLDDLDRGSGGLPGFVTDPLGVLRRRWLPMAVTFAVASVAATLVVLFFPERYEAAGRLLISGQSIRDEFVRTTIAEGVLEQLNAMVGEVIARDSLLQIAETHDLADGLDQVGSEDVVLAKLGRAISIVPDDSVQMGNNPGALIFAVKVTWPDPDKAAGVANDVVSRLIEANLERRSRQARLATDFLRREMERAEASLKEQSAKISEFKERYRGELPSELASKMARLERLQSQRAAIGMQISEAESRLVTLQTIGGESDPRLAALQELEGRLLREKTVNTPEHPNVLALQRQVESLREEMKSDPMGGAWSPTQRAAVEGARREIAQLRAQTLEIDAAMAELEHSVGRTPAREEELGGLEARERVLAENYADALRKLKEAELAESLELAQQGIQVSRLEPASPPSDPKLPLWQLVLGAVAGVLGLTAACGLLLELRDPVVLAGGELETLTGMTLLGEIPRAS